jgi:hypothetical protein
VLALLPEVLLVLMLVLVVDTVHHPMNPQVTQQVVVVVFKLV